MSRYASKAMELAPRDIVARSIQTGIDAGRGFSGPTGGYVHLDVRHLGAEVINARPPGIREIAMDFAGVDPIDAPIPVQPGQHYSMGGVACDENGETPLPGLFAVGECSCISVHGANRLGGNSLLETIVFGKRAGERAAQLVQQKRSSAEAALATALDEEQARIDTLKARQDGERQAVIRQAMQVLLTEKAGLFREATALREAVDGTAEIKERYRRVVLDNRGAGFNYDLVDTLELGGMLELAEVTAQMALQRTESRGSHSRTDFPARDDAEWLKHSMADYNPLGAPRLWYKGVMITRYQPMERKY